MKYKLIKLNLTFFLITLFGCFFFLTTNTRAVDPQSGDELTLDEPIEPTSIPESIPVEESTKSELIKEATPTVATPAAPPVVTTPPVVATPVVVKPPITKPPVATPPSRLRGFRAIPIKTTAQPVSREEKIATRKAAAEKAQAAGVKRAERMVMPKIIQSKGAAKFKHKRILTGPAGVAARFAAASGKTVKTTPTITQKQPKGKRTAPPVTPPAPVSTPPVTPPTIEPAAPTAPPETGTITSDTGDTKTMGNE